MNTPKRTVLLASIIVACLLTGLFTYLAKEVVTPVKVVIFALVGFAAVFAVLHWLLNRDIYNRLLPIYRTISGMTSTVKTPKDGDFMSMPVEETEQKVKNWADERITEIRSLQARDDFRQEFIGNLAHELKTPLFNIQGFVSSLLEGAVEDVAVRERFLSKAMKNVHRMTRIIEDLDDISHLEAGRLEMNLLPMDLTRTANDIISSLEEKAGDRDMTVKLMSTAPKIVVADEFRIGQVFTNLINNAITYGRDGGMVTVSFTDFEDRVLVEVNDDGPGIAPEKLPRLFERFYRVDKSRARDVGGTGLGLAIVKHILESHGQAVSAKSTVGEGSTFSFALAKAR